MGSPGENHDTEALMPDSEEEIAALRARLAELEDQPGPTAPKKPEPQKFAIGCLSVIAILALIGTVANCGGDKGQNPPAATPPSTSADTAVPPPPPPPSHHWTYRDGAEYGYQGALSDDQKKAGQVAADVSMFRYLGEVDGIYTVEGRANGDVVQASCKNPCDVVKLVTVAPYRSAPVHVAFNEDSIVGAALTDAFNGQLQIYSATHAPEQ